MSEPMVLLTWECVGCGADAETEEDDEGTLPEGWTILRESFFGIDALCPECSASARTEAPA